MLPSGCLLFHASMNALATSIEAERCFRGEEITWSSVMVILIIELKCLGVYDDRHR
jgi:hypothetical protein